jgi:NTE family protein
LAMAVVVPALGMAARSASAQQGGTSVAGSVNHRDGTASRTRLATNMLRERYDVRHAINELYKLLPREIARTAQVKRLLDHGCITTMGIVQLIYPPDEPQGSLKDFEFSRPTMEPRWQQGFADAWTTLQASPWLAPMPSELGVRVFDVIHDVLTRNEAMAEQPPLLR